MYGYPYRGWSYIAAGGAVDPNNPLCTVDDAKDNFDSISEDGPVLSYASTIGCGWADAALIVDNAALTAYEDMDDYSNGAITGPDMTGGSGWSDAPLLVNN